MGSNQIDHLSQRFIKKKGKDNIGMIILIEVGNRIGIDQLVMIGIED